ncbi:MAG: PTS sugar transporter subunit IIB [Solobacterium sp.]|nr:PTS sugar transporter subunit IIB [Solobacterium sp.]MBR2669425.1 PTS sugar transporter subunit IIB [Solobacterium sp.]
MLYKAIVCCRAGMGSSMFLKIKADQVIAENSLPIKTVHGNMDTLIDFNGDLVITMSDLSEELQGKMPYVIGIDRVADKNEIKEKLEKFLNDIE